MGEKIAMSNFHVLTAGTAQSQAIEVRVIKLSDVFDALKSGWNDFVQKPSHYAFIVLVYPVIGFGLFFWASRGDALQLIYPLISGFALIGPIAALGLYEISRRQERNQEASWKDAFAVVRSPAIPSIIAAGVGLLILFLLWIYTAEFIYAATFGDAEYSSIGAFVNDVLTTGRGWELIIFGNAAGFIFAVITLCTTVVTFPLLLDKDVGTIAAVKTSLRAVQTNPVPLFGWGLIVAALLVLGALPGLVGLIVVLPVLGHATWHIYRKLVPASDPVAVD